MPKKPRTSRRWCIPPAVLRGPHETLEGADLLSEFADNEALGVLLWRTMRDVTLWAGASPEARDRLFSDTGADRQRTRLVETEIPAAISAAMDTINGMMTIPDRADPSVITICCLEVSAWARHQQLLHTAITFAQAAALASPDFAEAALHTGIATSAAGQKPRAETWLRRSISLARREPNHPAYATALTELARLYEQRGDNARAAHLYRWAYLAGRRFKVRSARMQAAHGLFRLTRTQDLARAAQFALAAQRAYRPGVPGGPQLLLAVARFWVDTNESDLARLALRRLAVVRFHLPRPDQLLSWALTARAFAGTDTRFSALAATEAWRLLEAAEAASTEERLAVVIDLAHAARLSGDVTAFMRAQREALRIAPKEVFQEVSEQLSALRPENERSHGH
jgi:hypothetical protein